MQNQTQIPIFIFYPSCPGIYVQQIPFQYSNINQNNNSQLNVEENGRQDQQKIEQGIKYYNQFFSPKETAQSLKRRNDNLQLLNFDKSDEEPDDVFNRRIKKMDDLKSKQSQQINALLKIKQQDQMKFDAFINFMKFFSSLKQKLVGVRTDYYSNKTFCALKNSNENQLISLTRVMKQMYNNVMKQQKNQQNLSQSTSQLLDNRTSQFLILPRFFISKQKIIRLIKQQELKENFIFLIRNQLLGHYNNQANKKMPQKRQINKIKQLLQKSNGRMIFKRITSINHGNKFLKTYGEYNYYQLYNKSNQYLIKLQIGLRKGKKKLQILKKQLQQYQDLDNQYQNIQNNQIQNSQDNSRIHSSSYTQSQSSNGVYSLNAMNQCLKQLQKSKQDSSMNSQMLDQLKQVQNINKVQMKKKGLKRLNSMPSQGHQCHQQPQPQRRFLVRKAHTLQNKTTQNIIIIPPPSQSSFNHS